MKEILSKLLGSELLSEETKAELTAQFEAGVETLKTQLREEVEADVRAELTEQFVRSREELVEALDGLTNKIVEAEFDELHQEIEKFRDLEVEYAEREVVYRDTLAEQLKSELAELVDKLDSFLDHQVEAEFTELREDIEQVRKQEFGRKIFEAFEATFKQYRQDDVSSAERELAEAKDELKDVKQRLAELETARLAEAREEKLKELLKPLTGMARKQMEIILESVPAQKLEATYKMYIPRVLKESVKVEEKETEATLVESKEETTVVTGNEETLVESSTPVEDAATLRMRRLAGLA